MYPTFVLAPLKFFVIENNKYLGNESNKLKKIKKYFFLLLLEFKKKKDTECVLIKQRDKRGSKIDVIKKLKSN